MAGRHADPRPRGGAGPQPARVPPDAGRRRRARRCSGAPSAGAGGRIAGHPRDMARDTNFYYSFLVLTPGPPPGDRRGLGLLPRRRRRGGRGAGRDRGRSRRRPRPARRVAPRDRALLRRGRRPVVHAADAAGTRPGAVHPPVRPAARAAHGSRRRRRHGHRPPPVQELRRAVSVLLPRRLDGRHRLRPDLRLPGRPVARLRDGSRAGAAAHQHPARREEGPGAGPRSTFRSTTWRGSA